MAWISKPRQRKDGSLYWSVYFREPNPETGKKHQTSLSYDDYDDADRACQLIDQAGWLCSGTPQRRCSACMPVRRSRN